MHEEVTVGEVRVNQSTALEKRCERRVVTVVNVFCHHLRSTNPWDMEYYTFMKTAFTNIFVVEPAMYQTNQNSEMI